MPPSHSVMTGVASETGSRSRYSSITPRHGHAPIAAHVFALDPHDARNGAYDIQLAQVIDGRGQRGIGRRVA